MERFANLAGALQSADKNLCQIAHLAPSALHLIDKGLIDYLLSRHHLLYIVKKVIHLRSAVHHLEDRLELGQLMGLFGTEGALFRLFQIEVEARLLRVIELLKE